MFKKWIKEERVLGMPPIEGTGCFEKEFVNEGMFHAWASDCHEGENFGNYTVALVETKGGLIEMVLPFNIKFL